MPRHKYNNLVETTVDLEISTSTKHYILTTQGSNNANKYLSHVEVFQTISFFFDG